MALPSKYDPAAGLNNLITNGGLSTKGIQHPFGTDQSGGIERSSRDAQRTAATGVLANMASTDSNLLNTSKANTAEARAGVNKASGEFDDETKKLQGEAETQGKDAQSNYTNTIQPRQKSLMDDAYKDSRSAMSLADAGDVNNSVQTGVRGLYNAQGQKYQDTYNTSAQNEGRSGLADVGVLNSLGAQSLASQLGASGAPMTGGQMQALAGQNMAQGGAAYARTQQRMNALRQQGIDENIGAQKEGVNQGFAQSDAQYQRGQGVLNRASQTAKDYQTGGNINMQEQAVNRGERGGYTGAIRSNDLGATSANYDMSQGLSTMEHDLSIGQGNRQLGSDATYYGGQQAQAGADAGRAAGQTAAGIGAAGTVGGAVIGGMVGGPPGAAAGATLGSTVVNGTAPGMPNSTQAGPPQYTSNAGPMGLTSPEDNQKSPYPTGGYGTSASYGGR